MQGMKNQRKFVISKSLMFDKQFLVQKKKLQNMCGIVKKVKRLKRYI